MSLAVATTTTTTLGAACLPGQQVAADRWRGRGQAAMATTGGQQAAVVATADDCSWRLGGGGPRRGDVVERGWGGGE